MTSYFFLSLHMQFSFCFSYFFLIYHKDGKSYDLLFGESNVFFVDDFLMYMMWNAYNVLILLESGGNIRIKWSMIQCEEKINKSRM